MADRSRLREGVTFGLDLVDVTIFVIYSTFAKLIYLIIPFLFKVGIVCDIWTVFARYLRESCVGF